MSGKDHLTAFLKNPVVDKCLGFLNSLVMLYILYTFWLAVKNGHANIYGAAIALNTLVIVITTTIRRTAKRVSINPLFWFFTFLRNYWVYVVLSTVYVYRTSPLIPPVFTHALLLIGVGIIIYARLSLGRNIGFVPAQRELVMTGAYGLARHPIHTGELVFILSYMLASFTPLNFFLLSLGFIFIIVKSLIEESFLKDDKEYQAYCKKVPWRWVPGIV